MKKMNLLHFRPKKYTEHSIFFHFQHVIHFARPQNGAMFIGQQRE